MPSRTHWARSAPLATRTEDSGAGARAVADGARPRAGTGLALGEPCQTRAWGPSPLTPRWRCRGWLHLDGHDTCACAGPQPVTLRSVAGRRQDPARVTESERSARRSRRGWRGRSGPPPGTPPSSARLRGHRRLEGRSAVARRACHLSGPGARTPWLPCAYRLQPGGFWGQRRPGKDPGVFTQCHAAARPCPCRSWPLRYR